MKNEQLKSMKGIEVLTIVESGKLVGGSSNIFVDGFESGNNSTWQST